MLHAIRTILLIAFAVLLSAQTAEQLGEQAAAARQARRDAEAIALYRKALALKPGWTDGWWHLGVTLYEAERFAEAREAFQKGLELSPETGTGWAFLGLSEFQLAAYSDALQHLTRGLVLGYGDDQRFNGIVRYHTAILLIRESKFEPALELLLELARAGNKAPSVITAYGLGTLRMPLLPSAIPQEKRGVVDMAGEAAWAMIGQPSEAQRLFEQLVKTYPSERGVHYAYGFYLLATNAPAAVEEFRRETANFPDHTPAHLQIAFAEMQRGNTQEAIASARTAIRLEPANFMGHDALGRALLAAGDVKGAVSSLERAVALAPRVPQVHYHLEQAYRRAGRAEEAKREHDEFLKLQRSADPLSLPGAAPPR